MVEHVTGCVTILGFISSFLLKNTKKDKHWYCRQSEAFVVRQQLPWNLYCIHWMLSFVHFITVCFYYILYIICDRCFLLSGDYCRTSIFHCMETTLSAAQAAATSSQLNSQADLANILATDVNNRQLMAVSLLALYDYKKLSCHRDHVALICLKILLQYCSIVNLMHLKLST